MNRMTAATKAVTEREELCGIGPSVIIARHAQGA